MDLLRDFQVNLKEHTSFRMGRDKAVIAVSGGVDSMVLLTLCARMQVAGVVAHCNYHLRWDSDLDEQCVRTYAAHLSYSMRVQTFDKEHFPSSAGVEERARKLRYDFFQSLMEEEAAQMQGRGRVFLFTAHHSDDNIETALLHFFRPTGLLGLSAIPYQYENRLRPLLSCNKASLYDFALKEHIPFREDTTNKDNDFSKRNFLRNALLPQIEAHFPNVRKHILSNIQRYRETFHIYKQYTDKVRHELFRKQEGVWMLSVERIKVLQPLRSWVYELMIPFLNGAQQVEEVIKLLQAPSGKYLRTEKYQLLRHRKQLLIIPLKKTADSVQFPIVIDTLPFSCKMHGRDLYIESYLLSNARELKQENCFYLDKKTLSFPLLLRPHKQGDYFYPLGMKKKKKLTRFLRDERLMKTAREAVWVLESGAHIVCVLPLRIDDRHKVTATTRYGVCISMGKIRNILA